MNTYNLKVKDDFVGTTVEFPYPIGTKQKITTRTRYLGQAELTEGYLIVTDGSKKEVTQDELNQFPYGFTTFFDIIQCDDSAILIEKGQIILVDGTQKYLTMPRTDDKLNLFNTQTGEMLTNEDNGFETRGDVYKQFPKTTVGFLDTI